VDTNLTTEEVDWEITASGLPAGITLTDLAGQGAVLSGSTATAGVYRFKVRASALNGLLSSDKILWIVVADNPVFSATLGGNGGGDRPAVNCPSGKTAVGISYHSGNDVDRVDLNCAELDLDWNHSATSSAGAIYGTPGGGSAGTPYSCQDGEVLAGLSGRTHPAVHSLEGITCRDQGGNITPRGSSSGGDPTHNPSGIQSISCPGVTAAVGMEGRGGNYLDNVRLRCEGPLLLGKFENHHHDGSPVKGDYHYVIITRLDANTLLWTNRAGVSWTLSETADRSILNIGTDNPYNGSEFEYSQSTVIYNANGSILGITGPTGELYNLQNFFYDESG
jgi:hypothetical protein